MIVVVDRFAEAEARVDDDVGDAEVVELFEVEAEIGDDFVGDGGVVRVELHGGWCALHVHEDVGDVELGDSWEHLAVDLSGGDVVDDVDVVFAYGAFGHVAAEGVDGDDSVREEVADDVKGEGEARPFFFFGDVGGAGSGGVGANVDNVGAL